MERERRPGEAGPTTARTGAGGESARHDDAPADEQPLSWSQRDETPLDNDETVVAGPHSGGSPPGAVVPPPDADWPDPLGRDDEERELERRTR
jgi:hypothetical protein